MKNWLFIAFLASSLFFPPTLSAQISETLQDLEGVWYQESRQATRYTTWIKKSSEVLENQTIVIVCGDTILKSRALVRYAEQAAPLTMWADAASAGLPQQFRLVSANAEQLIWQNESPTASPQRIQWTFLANGYADFHMDNELMMYKRLSKAPLRWTFRMSMGANVNQYARPAGANRFLGRNGVAAATASTFAGAGQEVAFSAGVLFPSTRMCLNLEAGLAHRKVGVRGSFFGPRNAQFHSRDGVYENFNYYLALVPEVLLGKRRLFSISTGFYANIWQQRSFHGTASGGSPDSATGRPPVLAAHDVDTERGLIFGLNYRLPTFSGLQPQVYARHLYGLNNAKPRAFSLGIALALEKP